jgi:hypothetical protein
MLKVWRFKIKDDTIISGNKIRKKISRNGCNEPFKDRFWCPKMQWFKREQCPFMNRHECENFEIMCGSL